MNQDYPASIDAAAELLAQAGYVADRPLAAAVYLALALAKPLFLEGEPGVGKTELALALARASGRELIRLQCYEGLDAAATLYEWNYPKQLLAIKLAEATAQAGPVKPPDIFSPDFLLARPLLRTLTTRPAPVLLVDEIDRADQEFEAYLLELFSDWRITIPELGPITAAEPPLAVVTSNRTREVHDALKRRCLYHWIDFPGPAKELAVIRARLPQVEAELAGQAAAFLTRLRRLELTKKPGLAETLDWLQALLALEARRLDPAAVAATLGCLVKYRQDLALAQGCLEGPEGLLAGLAC